MRALGRAEQRGGAQQSRLMERSFEPIPHRESPGKMRYLRQYSRKPYSYLKEFSDYQHSSTEPDSRSITRYLHDKDQYYPPQHNLRRLKEQVLILSAENTRLRTQLTKSATAEQFYLNQMEKNERQVRILEDQNYCKAKDIAKLWNYIRTISEESIAEKKDQMVRIGEYSKQFLGKGIWWAGEGKGRGYRYDIGKETSQTYDKYGKLREGYKNGPVQEVGNSDGGKGRKEGGRDGTDDRKNWMSIIEEAFNLITTILNTHPEGTTPSSSEPTSLPSYLHKCLSTIRHQLKRGLTDSTTNEILSHLRSFELPPKPDTQQRIEKYQQIIDILTESLEKSQEQILSLEKERAQFIKCIKEHNP